MKSFILLFSHSLNASQINDAKTNLKIENFISLDEDLATLWANIPPELSNLTSFLTPFKEFIKNVAKNGDFILIQGDFGAVYEMVGFSKSLNLTPVYATTKRIVKIDEIGAKVLKSSTFEHIRFRRY